MIDAFVDNDLYFLQVILDHSENGELHPHNTVSVRVCDNLSLMHS